MPSPVSPGRPRETREGFGLRDIRRVLALAKEFNDDGENGKDDDRQDD
jgi:hypothetical protein